MDNPVETRKKVTIRTVAKEAGVSVAAVSKVLRNAYGVSDTLRDKVQKSIDRLGYRPSTAARGLRGSTYTAGMLLVDMSNPFLPAVIDGVKRHLRECNYKLMISVSDGRRQIENGLIESMIDLHMDGLVLVAPQCSADTLENYARQIPMVVIGHHVPGSAHLDTVNSHDFEGARLATAALIEKGYRTVHMCSLPAHEGDEGDVYHVRETGYHAAMEEAGLGGSSRIHRLSQRSGEMERDIRELLSGETLPEAVFCWSDIHAVALINEASSMGISVPDRLAIVGYDDTPVAAMPLVSLSSIDQDPDRLGTLAAELLLSRLEGRTEAVHALHPPRLVARGSF